MTKIQTGNVIRFVQQISYRRDVQKVIREITVQRVMVQTSGRIAIQGITEDGLIIGQVFDTLDGVTIVK